MSKPDEKIIDDSITTATSSSHQDVDGRITPSHKSPQRSSSIDEGDDVNGPLETIAGLMGNVLEWYDFALFGYFSDVIGKVFFAPSTDGGNNLIKSFAVYGGAFLMRPIGGITLGHFGDKYGRKQAGISVGGQLPATLMYTVEMRPRKHWGYYGSLVMCGANVGTLVGNFVGAIIRSALTYEQLVAWGWRIPFLTGILNGLVAWFLHCKGKDHHPNRGVYHHEDDGENDDTREKFPLRNVLKKENLPALLSATLTPMLFGAGFYVSFVWMATYMQVLLKPGIENAFWVNAMALLFGVVLILPLTGFLSDRVGRTKTMICGAISLGIVGPFMLWVISAGQAVSAFFAQWTIGVLLSLFGGPMNAWLVEKFPPDVRLTSAALGYDLAHCTASAFSPLIATILVENVGPVAPSIHREGGIEEGEEDDDGLDATTDDDLSTALL
eukprot:scaffold14929_cov154-Skeletonema_marinoi.AAC.6